MSGRAWGTDSVADSSRSYKRASVCVEGYGGGGRDGGMEGRFEGEVAREREEKNPYLRDRDYSFSN